MKIVHLLALAASLATVSTLSAADTPSAQASSASPSSAKASYTDTYYVNNPLATTVALVDVHGAIEQMEKAVFQDQFGLPPEPPPIVPMSALPESLFAACASRPGRRFNSASYLAAAVALQALPREVALGQLKRWAAEDDAINWTSFRSRVLCLMLFEPKPDHILLQSNYADGSAMSPTHRGSPIGRDYDRFPATPGIVKLSLIVLVDEIPFLTVDKGGIAGRPPRADLSMAYFEYCRANGQWTSRHYHTADAVEFAVALKKVQDWFTKVQQAADLAQPPFLLRTDLPPADQMSNQFFANQIASREQ